jgi:hypothetical protein
LILSYLEIGKRELATDDDEQPGASQHTLRWRASSNFLLPSFEINMTLDAPEYPYVPHILFQFSIRHCMVARL